MVSILSMISNSSNSLSKPLGAVQSTQITTGITGTLMFSSFLSSLARSLHAFVLSIDLIFTQQVFIFSLINSSSSLLVGIRLSVCISKSQSIYVLFCRIDYILYINRWVLCSNFTLLCNTQWITSPCPNCIYPCTFLTLVCHVI